METGATDGRGKSGRQAARLTLAATHLGNPADIPARSLDALRQADLLLFEEDRPARAALKAAGVHRDYLKLTEHGEALALEECAATLKRGGWVNYMSDQGTPGFADPGRELVALAHRLGAAVEVIPGPNAIAAAVAACPFDCRRFNFAGFPPRDPAGRLAWLRREAAAGHPVILMDTPYRLAHVLRACAEVFETGRQGSLSLDISGPAEAHWVGTFASLAGRAAEIKDLNFVLIIAAGPALSQPAVTESRPGKRRGPRRS